MPHSADITKSWFAATATLDVNKIRDLVFTKGSYLLGVQKETPTVWEDFEEITHLFGSNTVGMTAVHQVLLSPLDLLTDENTRGQRSILLMYLIENSSIDQLRIRWGQGNTALHIASYLGDVEMVKCLLQKGVPYNLQNDLAFAPIDVAHGHMTSQVFHQHAMLQSRPKHHRRIHSTNSVRHSQAISLVVDESDPSINHIANEITSPVQCITKCVSVPVPIHDEQPITFQGKYINPILLDTKEPISPTLKNIPTASSNNIQPIQFPTAGKGRRPRIVGVDLTPLFDDVLGDSSEPDEWIPPNNQSDTRHDLDTSKETGTCTSSIPAMPHLRVSTAPNMPIHPSPKQPTPNTSNFHIPNKQPTVQHPTETNSQLHPSSQQTVDAPSLPVPIKQEEDVDECSFDFRTIRQNFATMTQINPQVPKNPTESLAGVYAMAAVNGNPNRRKWRTQGNPIPNTNHDTHPKLCQIKQLHQKCDSGLERDGLSMSRSVSHLDTQMTGDTTSEHHGGEHAGEEQEDSGTTKDPPTTMSETDTVEERGAVVEIPGIEKLSLLSFDLDFGIDDFKSVLALDNEEQGLVPLDSVQATLPECVNDGSDQVTPNHSISVQQQPAIIIKTNPVSSSHSRTIFGGGGDSGCLPRPPTKLANPKPFTSPARPLPQPNPSITSTTSPPKTKKQVKFTTALPTATQQVVYDQPRSQLILFKVTQISGLEWILTERQMTHVFVSVIKDGHGLMYSSRPHLVLSDKVTLHEEAAFEVNQDNKLSIEIKLRMEKRHPPHKHSSILSNLKFMKKEDTVKDIVEEVLTRLDLDVTQLISEPIGKIVTSCHTSPQTNKSIVSIHIATLALPADFASDHSLGSMVEVQSQLIQNV